MNAYEVLAQEPDPVVVTDASAREKIAATGKPWKIRHVASGIVMLLCPPGEFVMGEGRGAHRRTIGAAFYLSQNEVSKAEWRAIAGDAPGYFKVDELPVETVSWNDIHEDFLGPARGFFRLPSKAEWEFACRAGTTTRYSFGETITNEQACYDSQAPVACGSLPANPWGFHEMHGNVWEWVADAHAGRSSEAGGQEAVEGDASSDRVWRGGSWSGDSYSVRSSTRDYGTPRDAISSLGFRVAANCEHIQPRTRVE